VKLYDANRLNVTRQLAYQVGSTKTIDLGLFVNGLLVATAELKNALTGQSIEHAISQYRTNRDPASIALSKRASVHFAVDTERVAMTTRLAGESTRFLPFNLGDAGGAGNPTNPTGIALRTCGSGSGSATRGSTCSPDSFTSSKHRRAPKRRRWLSFPASISEGPRPHPRRSTAGDRLLPRSR
jgi:hypothetical protein